MKRTTRLVAALATSLAALSGSPAIAGELGSDLAGLLDFARAQNPELAAMRHEADAANERIQPAGALPDPVLRVELENINNYGSSNPPSLLPSKVGDTKYTLMQPIPLWGKRDLRRDVAAADAQQASARAGVTWNELAGKVKVAYAQYFLAAGTERITREVLDLLARMEQIAQARYTGGLAAQQDAIRAQVEQTTVRTELISLDADKRQAAARLNALLARDAGAALAEPQALRPLPAATTFDAGALEQRARATNPAVAAEEARLRGAQSNRELTLRNRYPDIQVGIVPTQMGSRITTWGLMVEMNIPLQRETRRSQEREAEAIVSAQLARTQALQAQLLGELGENLAGLDAARRSEALIGTQLLPQTELSFRSALAAYENGRVDFATLLEAQRQIRKAKADRLKAQVEAQVRLTELERIVGEDL
ncbi:TolC family protein [Variovorax sp. HW608]|uniref:TolC family protein n=1 Tax=Variovorax sp. HW608 TaxID=1034889 RepID=UPI001E4CA7A2|nr:TolC family protein [Variovorax sp. HW608]